MFLHVGFDNGNKTKPHQNWMEFDESFSAKAAVFWQKYIIFFMNYKLTLLRACT